MKEQTLIEMRNKVAELNQIVQNLYMELTYQRQINEALANVCKQLPDWDKAVEAIKKQHEEKAKAEAEKLETDTESGLDLGPQEQEEVQQEEEAQK